MVHEPNRIVLPIRPKRNESDYYVITLGVPIQAQTWRSSFGDQIRLFHFLQAKGKDGHLDHGVRCWMAWIG